MSASRPNILLVMTDQQRPDWVGMSSSVPVRTPHLDALAQRGCWFPNAITPSPVCAPARACLATGMDYDGCGVTPSDMDLPLDRTTYYRRLRDEAGYHVAGCGKFDLQKDTQDWGLDGWNRMAEWGFSSGCNTAGKVAAGQVPPGDPADPYTAFLDDRGLAELHVDDHDWRREFGGAYLATWPTPLPADAYMDNWIGRTGRRLLEDLPTDQPWHLQVNFVGPHEPMDVTDRLHAFYRDPPVEFPLPEYVDDVQADTVAANQSYEAGHHQAIRRNYAAMIENVDRWLGRYLSTLRHRGELDATLVVVTSDHGDMLGDHGLWTKQAPYRESVGVPLVVAAPGVTSRPPIGSPTSLLDLHSTFLDYAGLEPGDVDSRSMRPVLSGESDAHRSVARSGIGPWRLVTDGRFKLIAGYDPSQPARRQVADFEADEARNAADVTAARDFVLYDLERDEVTNRAEAHPHRLARLRAALPLSVTDSV